MYFAAIRNRHADRGAWITAAHDTHGYTLAEIAAAVGLQDTRPDPYCAKAELARMGWRVVRSRPSYIEKSV
ncbi:MAG: hypothetical protein IH856_15560 [Deltaproteobacteria bacterium]|nr:hypothetical protein [Deltaproteobacteria bacterium]